MNSFKPYKISTKNQALDGNSHAIALPQVARSGDVIKVVVIGTEAAFIKTGSSTVTASTSTDMPQLAGSVETYSLDDGTSHIAVNGSAGSTVYITMGVGL